ncbi:MAG TPA: 2-dehydropantoate 2-reductase N-terminal domain-containing protein, partial [Rubrobacter sp.]|nr:2-dehydropantoate 2-reductase N-terminal domain-containing protein [Rubrobacter sp.]
MAESFSVGVVGSGYVGLVTGACLAHIGHRVSCVDKNGALVDQLREGRMPIYEPGLEELVSRDVSRGRLSFTTDLPEVVRDSDVVFIAVDTPQGDDGSADLGSVAAVARSIGGALAGISRNAPLVVVNKSTVPVGSGDYVSMLIREGAAENDGEDVDYR